MTYVYSHREPVPVMGSHHADSGSPRGPYFSEVASANTASSRPVPRPAVLSPNGMNRKEDYGYFNGSTNRWIGNSMTGSEYSDQVSLGPAPTSLSASPTGLVTAPKSVVSYLDCLNTWCPPPRPSFEDRKWRPCNPCRPCGNCSSCRLLYSRAQAVINADNWAHMTANNPHRSIIHLESIEVAVPSPQLLQRAKAVLAEQNFPSTAKLLFTAKFMEGLDVMKMTDAVSALGESLSRKLETENMKGRITALLRPFFLMAVGSGKVEGKNPSVAFCVNGDEVTVLNFANDDAKDAGREGRDVVQDDIDKFHDYHTGSTSPGFYQILITAAYSYRQKVFNFGFCYIQRKDSSVAKLLGDPYTKGKRVAAMKIECSAPLAQVLRAMSFSRSAVTLVRNDGYFESQAALL